MTSVIPFAESSWLFTPKDAACGSIHVQVVLYPPLQDSSGDWRCDFEYRYDTKVIKRFGIGSDSLDALSSALFILATDLQAYARDNDGEFSTAEKGIPLLLKLKMSLAK